MKILMVGHSYVVALNRRLCREVAQAGGPAVLVTVAAPDFVHGDLRPVPLEPLEGEPYELVPIPTRLSRVPQLLHYSRKLRALARRDAWDVVHVWQEPYVLAGFQAARAAPRSSALVFSSFQNLYKHYPPPFNWIEHYCLSRTAGWTAFGQTIADTLRDRPGYRGKPMRTIPLGVDLEIFRPDGAAGRWVRAELGWSESGPPVVGYLGRFVPQKGLHLLMNALDRLPPDHWRALFVGSGAMEGELRAWAGRHPGRALVVTGVKHDDVPPYLNAMDLLAAPSQTTRRWKEQLGRMLLEAMGCGVPILASDSGEIPFVVANAGRIAPEADEDAWVAALGELLDSPDRRRELRTLGLARVHAVYAWPRIAGEFLDFFRALREPRAVTATC